MRSKGEGVSLDLRSASCLSVLPALSKGAGGGGKTVTVKFFAVRAHIQAGWQPLDLRSCCKSQGTPNLMLVVLVRS